MNKPARNPLSTAQNLTTAGLDREIADIIVGAIHESHADLESRIRESYSDLERRIDESHAVLAKGQAELAKEIALRPTREEIANQFATKLELAEVKTSIADLGTQMQRSTNKAIALTLAGMGLMLAVLKYFGG